MNFQQFTEAAQAVASEFEGLQIRLEKEADDCWTCFLDSPIEGSEEVSTCELSVYHLGKKDGFFLSLEAETVSPENLEAADQFAEELALRLDAVSLDF